MIASVLNNLGNQRTKQVSMQGGRSDLTKVILDCMNPTANIKVGNLIKAGGVVEKSGDIKGLLRYFRNSKFKFKAEINHVAGRKDFTIIKFDKNGKSGDVIEYMG